MLKSTKSFLLKAVAGVIVVATAVAGCDRYLDRPLALWVKGAFYGNRTWAHYTGDLPDLLLMVVLLTTAVTLPLYLIRVRKGIFDKTTRLDKLLAWSAPVSYLVKSVLKPIFGRANTRFWLKHPESYGFHWFSLHSGYDGFPSGHMIVMVTMLAAVCRFYPRLRAATLLVVLLMGGALVGTNFHYLSDVIAGIFLGLLTEALMFRALFTGERDGAA